MSRNQQKAQLPPASPSRPESIWKLWKKRQLSLNPTETNEKLLSRFEHMSAAEKAKFHEEHVKEQDALQSDSGKQSKRGKRA